MEDNERGFHVVGGLLLIGTWWVFILGFVYTIIRKNVPYIATPKDVKDEKNLKNNLPNILVLAISVISIIYGLNNDWSPFTLFMSGIVSLNCLFMIFMLVASSELKLQGYVGKHATLFNIVSKLQSGKRYFWLLRRSIYTGVRKVSLILTVLVICISIYASYDSGEDLNVNTIRHNPVPYTGKNVIDEIISTSDTTGLSHLINQSKLYVTANKPTLRASLINATLQTPKTIR
jgi:cellulose synthase (UDP-forming)